MAAQPHNQETIKSSTLPRSERDAVWYLAYAIPALLLFWAILTFSVDLFYKDELLFVPRLEKLHPGTFTFSDLFELHLDHRPVTSFSLIAGLLFTVGWSGPQKYLIAFAISCGNFFLLWHMLRHYADELPILLRHVLVLLTSIFAFSLIPITVWTQGMLFSIPLLLFLSLIPIALWATQRLSWSVLILAALACLGATLTLHQGILSWVAPLPIIVLRAVTQQVSWKKVIAWVLLSGFTVSAYYSNFTPVEFKEGTTTRLPTIWEALQFFFTFLGAPLVPTYQPVAVIIGFVLVVSTLVASAVLWRHGTKKQKLTTWVSVLLLAWLMAAAVTAGRGWLGADYALRPRYLVMSSIGFVASLVLIFTSLHVKSARTTITYALFTLIGSIAIGNSLAALPQWKTFHDAFSEYKMCITRIESAPGRCLTPLDGGSLTAEEIRHRLTIFQKLGK